MAHASRRRDDRGRARQVDPPRHDELDELLKAGLAVECLIDESIYETGRSISDDEFRSINIKPNDNFHPEWNYTIYPRGWNIDTDQNRDLPKPES